MGDDGDAPPVRRRRRSSAKFEDLARKRMSRQSMPAVSYDGLLREPSVGIASGALSEHGSTVPYDGRPRRTSDMSFTLPGVTGRLYDDADGTGDEEQEVEEEYMFPAWWFVALCLPGLVHSLVSGALWGVIWPDLLSKMAGEKYKAIVFAAGGQISTIIGYSNPFIGTWSDRLPDKYAKYCGRRRPFIIVGGFIAAFGVWMTCALNLKRLLFWAEESREPSVENEPAPPQHRSCHG